MTFRSDVPYAPGPTGLNRQQFAEALGIARVDTHAWEHDGDGFVATVRARPHVALAINATVPAGRG